MNFQGTAIYLDADMLLLADIAELAAMKPSEGRGIKCLTHSRTDVAVFDCAWFQHKSWWPTIAQMKTIPARVFEYVRMLQDRKALDTTLPGVWNDIDGNLFDIDPDAVKLLHYSHVMVGQPWRPYDNVQYPETWPYVRTSYKAAETWFEYQGQMVAGILGL